MDESQKRAKLVDFARELLYKKSLLDGLPHISKYAKEIIGADRCSIFIYNAQSDELWTTLADGVDKIIVPSNKGIVGQTIKLQKPIVENDPYSNPNFLPDIDKETGYNTINIVAVPIFNSQKEIAGVLELLNKNDGFNEDDIKFMTFFAHYISGFMELINLY